MGFFTKDHDNVTFKDGVTVSRKKDKPRFGESGRQGSDSIANWDKFFGLSNANPDDVGIGTYKEMLKDAEVKTGYNIIRHSILSRNWKVSFPEKGKDAYLEAQIIKSDEIGNTDCNIFDMAKA